MRLEHAGVTIAGLQEVHGPQAQGAGRPLLGQVGDVPGQRHTQNKVIWDRNSWEMTDSRLVQIPYFGGTDVGMPLVQLTSDDRPGRRSGSGASTTPPTSTATPRRTARRRCAGSWPP